MQAWPVCDMATSWSRWTEPWRFAGRSTRFLWVMCLRLHSIIFARKFYAKARTWRTIKNCNTAGHSAAQCLRPQLQPCVCCFSPRASQVRFCSLPFNFARRFDSKGWTTMAQYWRISYFTEASEEPATSGWSGKPVSMPGKKCRCSAHCISDC